MSLLRRRAQAARVSASSPNGLPVFTLNYTNDDDGERLLGSDSRLIFTAPAKARYLVRVSDTRGWSGDALRLSPHRARARSRTITPQLAREKREDDSRRQRRAVRS